jgi:iron complex transport system permease protein
MTIQTLARVLIKEPRIVARTFALHLLLVCALLALVPLSAMFGAADYPLETLWRAMFDLDPARDVADASFVLWQLRLPRVCLAMMIGLHLAASGLTLQAALRNPLAEPGVLGVSSGATLGVMVLVVLANVSGSLDSSRLYANDTAWLPLAALAGGVGAALAVHALAWRGGTAPHRLVLMGIAVGAALYALAMTILAGWGSNRIEVLLTWLSGNLYARDWRHVRALVPWTVATLTLLPCVLPAAQALALGDDAAASVGLAVERWRLAAIAYAALAAAGAVAIAGPIAFVGLIAPHLARRTVGGTLSAQAPCALMFGALITALADLIGRIAIAPTEIPVGAVTAVCGGTLFLYLLTRPPR